MGNRRRRNPFDPKTGRAVSTPVLRATGERLDLESIMSVSPNRGRRVFGRARLRPSRHPEEARTEPRPPEYLPISRSSETLYATFPRSKALGYHGQTQDLKSSKWYAVYGKECDILGCNCDAWVEEIPGQQKGRYDALTLR